MTTALALDLPEYLSAHIDQAVTGCWLWTGPITSDGYGRAYVPKQDGTKGRQERAHRCVWAALIGPPTPGLVIDHLCRVTLCVNPEHLEEVSQRVNIERSAANGGALYVSRPKPMVCKYGHPYDEANSYTVPRGPNAGNLQCRKCFRMRDRWRRAAPFMPPEYRAIGERMGYAPRRTAAAST